MIRSIALVPNVDPRAQLGDLIKRCRIELNFSHRDVGRRAGASADEVRDWESGEAVPNGRHWARLKGSFYRLAGAAAIWQAALRAHDGATEDVAAAAEVAELEELTMPAIEPPPVPPGDLPPLVDPRSEDAWGKSLARARVNEGVSQRELAELVSVEQGTISSWERGEVLPVRDNYRKPCSLFPVLEQIAEPPIRDIPKPVGGTAHGNQGRPPGTPQPPPLLAPPIPAPRPILAIAPAAKKQTDPEFPKLGSVELAGIAFARAKRDFSDAKAEIAAAEHELERARERAVAAQQRMEETAAALDRAIADEWKEES